MSITIQGNHSKGYLSNAAGGNGVQNVGVGIGWMSVSASAIGDIAYVDISGALLSNINQGIFFQSEAAATVLFTLCNPNMAKDPDPNVQGMVKWGNSTSVANDGTIVKAPVLFTALKITFAAAGTFYIGVR